MWMDTVTFKQRSIFSSRINGRVRLLRRYLVSLKRGRYWSHVGLVNLFHMPSSVLGNAHHCIAVLEGL